MPSAHVHLRLNTHPRRLRNEAQERDIGRGQISTLYAPELVNTSITTDARNGYTAININIVSEREGFGKR